MKIQLLLVFSVMILFNVGCGNKAQQNEGEEKDSIGVDSTKEISEKSMASEETIVTKLAIRDLGIFELRGHVQSCIWNRSGNSTSLVFNEKGQWKAQDKKALEDLFPGGLTRDKDGRLTDAWADGYGSVHYKYNSKGQATDIQEDGFKRKLVYDTDGYVAKEVREIAPEIGDDEGEPETTTLKYTILEKDEVGNWTRRKSNEGLETRVITYFK